MASITDELRAWSKEHLYKSGIRSDLLAIADRIDAEHEAKVSYWQGASYKDGYDEGFAGADDWLGQHEDAMAEHGWVKLPVDADGVPIRVGDVMDGNRGTVTCIRDAGHGWEIVTDHMYSYNPADLHHHKLTVEDVLDEFASAYDRIGGEDDEQQKYINLIAEYATKLRLAGDAE